MRQSFSIAIIHFTDNRHHRPGTVKRGHYGSVADNKNKYWDTHFHLIIWTNYTKQGDKKVHFSWIVLFYYIINHNRSKNKLMCIMESVVHNQGAPVEAVGREGDVRRAQRV